MVIFVPGYFPAPQQSMLLRKKACWVRGKGGRDPPILRRRKQKTEESVNLSNLVDFT